MIDVRFNFSSTLTCKCGCDIHSFCNIQFTILVFQNEEIFVQLDELDELDRITHAWIGFNYSLTQAQKTF